MKRVLKEPLLHFLLIGAALFAANSLLYSRTEAEPGQIVVTQGRIDSLVTGFTRTWQRPPTARELDDLIRDFVREEVAVREATALGLDRDDTIIRRRLRQKLEFVSDDLAAHAEPTEAQLRAYLEEHPEAFRTESAFTFRQIYFNPDHHPGTLERDASELLAQLNRGIVNADVSAMGDASLLDYQFDAMPASEITKVFGDAFAARLGEGQAGHWHGPIESGYGLHLVFIQERAEGRLPAFEDVREAVRTEWANALRVKASDAFYQALLERYAVTIEQPESASAEKPAADPKP